MAKPTIKVVAAVVGHQGRYLLTQRRAHAVLPLLWEFPGGRVEENEAPSAALIRNIRSRLGVTLEVVDIIGTNHHEYSNYLVEMIMFECLLPEGQVPQAIGVEDIRWVGSEDMSDYDFPPADERSMDKLLGIVSN